VETLDNSGVEDKVKEKEPATLHVIGTHHCYEGRISSQAVSAPKTDRVNSANYSESRN